MTPIEKANAKAIEESNKNQENTSNIPSTTDTIENKEVETNIPKLSRSYIDSRLEGLIFPLEQKREVIIRRRVTQGALPGLDPNDTVEKIGPSFKGSVTCRGLTKAEEVRFLTIHLGIAANSPSWETETKDFWCNIGASVPPNGKDNTGGLKLETGLRYETSEEYLKDLDAPKDLNGVIINSAGEPINMTDYILWRYCLMYVEVANDISMVNNSPKIRFYMFTKEKEIEAKKVILGKKREASSLFNQNISDRNWVDYMLRNLIALDKSTNILVKDIGGLSADEKDVMLFDYIEKDITKFISLAKDKNLEMRSFIEIAISLGRLTRVPNTTTVMHEGITIGNTTEEVVSYLNNPRNGEFYRTLKAQINVSPY